MSACVCSLSDNHETYEMLQQTDDSIGEEDGDHSLHRYKKVLPFAPSVWQQSLVLFPPVRV